MSAAAQRESKSAGSKVRRTLLRLTARGAPQSRGGGYRLQLAYSLKLTLSMNHYSSSPAGAGAGAGTRAGAGAAAGVAAVGPCARRGRRGVNFGCMRSRTSSTYRMEGSRPPKSWVVDQSSHCRESCMLVRRRRREQADTKGVLDWRWTNTTGEESSGSPTVSKMD